MGRKANIMHRKKLSGKREGRAIEEVQQGFLPFKCDANANMTTLLSSIYINGIDTRSQGLAGYPQQPHSWCSAVNSLDLYDPKIELLQTVCMHLSINNRLEHNDVTSTVQLMLEHKASAGMQLGFFAKKKKPPQWEQEKFPDQWYIYPTQQDLAPLRKNVSHMSFYFHLFQIPMMLEISLRLDPGRATFLGLYIVNFPVH
jgi:hypothetical protein